jgi:hypothetical protein
MAPVVYTVTADFEDEPTLRAYLAWLSEGHAEAVCRAGALRAEVIGPLGTPHGPLEGPLRLECRYTFPTLAAFRTYEADHAPRLRAEGVVFLGTLRGVRVSRSVAELAGRWSGTEEGRRATRE